MRPPNKLAARRRRSTLKSLVPVGRRSRQALNATLRAQIVRAMTAKLGADGAAVSWTLVERRRGRATAVIGEAWLDGAIHSPSRILRRVDARRMSAWSGVLAHPCRIRILERLLASHAGYQDLVRVTRLHAGPLGFHVRELAGLRLIKHIQRDRYELTVQGRRALAAAVVVMSLMRGP